MSIINCSRNARLTSGHKFFTEMCEAVLWIDLRPDKKFAAENTLRVAKDNFDVWAEKPVRVQLPSDQRNCERIHDYIVAPSIAVQVNKELQAQEAQQHKVHEGPCAASRPAH